MNKDNIEGGVRSAAGEVKEFVGRGTGDAATTASGLADKAMGGAQSAFGNAKSAIGSAAESAAELTDLDLRGLRDSIAKLTDTVGKMVTEKVATAGDSVARATAATQDRVMAFEGDFENRVRRSPLAAVGIAVAVGALLGVMSSSSRR
jgi:uncharacterized protein YjbJ (UPF0337 family)